MNESILTLAPDANPLLKRAMLFLESGDFTSATEYCGKVLDTEPENSFAYLAKLMAEKNIRDEKQLVSISKLREDQDFKFARRFASPDFAAKLDALIAENERNFTILAPIRKACVERQEKLNQLLSGGLSANLASEVQKRIAAEQALMRDPSEETAEREAAATNALIDRIGKIRELRAACAGRQQTLRQLLGGELSENLKAKVRSRIAAEEKLMRDPDKDAAAKEAAATTQFIANMAPLARLCALVSQMEALLPQRGVTLSETQAQQLSERIAAAKALMANPAPESRAVNLQIAACEAALTGGKKAKSLLRIMLIVGAGLIVVAAILSFFFWTFVEPHLSK